MKHFGRLMLLTLGLGLFAVVLSSLPAAGGPPATNVNVVNTPNVNANITNASVPVTGSVSAAVTGTVGVNNFPAFPATLTGSTVPVSGTLSATLASGASVTVGNTSTNPVLTQATDNPAQQPFQVYQSQATSFPSFNITVPTGKTMVIEEFVLACSISGPVTGYYPIATIAATAGGVGGVIYDFVPTTSAPPGVTPSGTGLLIYNQLTHIYADPLSTVNVQMSGDVYPATSPFCSLSVSGHLVNTI